MKRNAIVFGSMLFVAGTLLMSGCKKDDTTAPVITVTGDNPLEVILNSTYNDPGASANDDTDGNLTTGITNNITATNPDVNKTGTYTITYKVSDAAGNEGTATRTVRVFNQAEVFEGDYTVVDTVYKYTYDEHITASQTLNKRISFSSFAAYSNCAAYADVTGTTVGSTITVPSQAFVGIGDPPADRTFQGTGLVMNTTQFEINYTETTNSGTVNAKGTYTKK